MLQTDVKQMLADEKAVSPVIGVILMVAVTVVLAALIGAFVFGLGDDLGASAPNAQVDFSFDGSEESLTVTHDGGQSITNENSGALFISGDDDVISDGDFDWRDGLDVVDQNEEGERANVEEGASISAGSTILETSNVGDADNLQLQWESPDGDQTATLGEWNRP